jgi:hypothetical protein
VGVQRAVGQASQGVVQRGVAQPLLAAPQGLLGLGARDDVGSAQ